MERFSRARIILLSFSRAIPIIMLMSARQKIRSKAFQRGLREGASGPFLLFARSGMFLKGGPRATIGHAWDKVDRSIADSLEKEKARGKTASVRISTGPKKLETA